MRKKERQKLITVTTAQLDAKHVKELTKQDILDFYDWYIASDSPHRAKLVVELFARGETAVEELVVKALEQIPTSATEELQATVRASVVEAVMRGSAEQLASHLQATAGVTAELAAAIVDSIGAAVATVAQARDDSKTMEFELPDNVHGVNAKFITDTALWKRGLEASTGALPCKDLREFEELAPKL